MITVAVNNIIDRALRIIRAESTYQSQNSDARTFALDSLNDILNIMSATDTYLPYYNVLEFNLVPNQAEYTIGTQGTAFETFENITGIYYVNVFTQGIKYPVKIVNDFVQRYTSYPVNVSGIPGQVYIRKEQNDCVLVFYPAPVSAYKCEILYKSAFADVQYGKNIAIPDYYRKFLIYWLAKELSIDNNLGTWDANAESNFQKYDNIVKAAVQKDNSILTRTPVYPFGYFGYLFGAGIKS